MTQRYNNKYTHMYIRWFTKGGILIDINYFLLVLAARLALDLAKTISHDEKNSVRHVFIYHIRHPC